MIHRKSGETNKHFVPRLQKEIERLETELHMTLNDHGIITRVQSHEMKNLVTEMIEILKAVYPESTQKAQLSEFHLKLMTWKLYNG